MMMSAPPGAEDVAGGDVDTAGEVRIQGLEGDDRLERLAVEDGDLRAAARTGRGDDVRHTVAVDVGHRDHGRRR